LFAPRCPSHVGWFVMSIVIWITVQRMLHTWTRADIYYKVVETFPSLANANSPSAILGEVVAIRIGATVQHGSPRVVLGAFARTMFGYSFFEEASAGETAPCFQRASYDGLFCTALASTKPSGFVAVTAVWLSGNDCKSTKYPADEISAFHGTTPVLLDNMCGRLASDQPFGSYPSHADYCSCRTGENK
jgi:hypothetical protein